MGNPNPASEKEALRVLDEFMSAFNARDGVAHAKTLNYPHVRLASGRVSVWNNPEDFAETRPARVRRIEPDWDHSVWDSREVIQSGDDKVHIAVQFTRYDQSGAKIATYQSLYIVTCLNGHWGVQARSSFAQ